MGMEGLRKMKLLPLATRDQFVPLLSSPFPPPVLIQRLPIKGLLRSERVINPSQVSYYKRLTPDHDPVRVVFWKGRRIIWDGNHRVHARLNKGLKTVRAIVYAVE